jgi:hypothetical protein
MMRVIDYEAKETTAKQTDSEMVHNRATVAVKTTQEKEIMVYSDPSPEERERRKRVADFERERSRNSQQFTLKNPTKPLREIFTDPQAALNEILLEQKAQSEILEKILLCLKQQKRYRP